MGDEDFARLMNLAKPDSGIPLDAMQALREIKAGARRKARRRLLEDEIRLAPIRRNHALAKQGMPRRIPKATAFRPIPGGVVDDNDQSWFERIPKF